MGGRGRGSYLWWQVYLVGVNSDVSQCMTTSISASDCGGGGGLCPREYVCVCVCV